MKEYSRIKAIPLSFFSRPLYRDIARNWGGVGFSYLLMIIVVFQVLPLTVFVNCAMHFFAFEDDKGRDLIRHYSYQIADQLPPMKLHKGKLSAEGPQPLSIFVKDDAGKSTLLAIIDTTGKIKSVRDTDAPILVTAEEVQLKKSKAETRSFSFNELDKDMQTNEELVLDKKSARFFIDMGLEWRDQNKLNIHLTVAAFTFFGILFALFIWRMIASLLIAIAGSIMASANRIPLDFQQTLRLACVASTPALLVGMGAMLAGINIPMLVIVAINLGYIFFAVYSNRE